MKKIARAPSLSGIFSSVNVLTLLLGVISGIVLLIAAALGKKWLVAASLGLAASFSFLILTRNIKNFFLFTAVYFIPIRLDFYLIYKETDFAQLKGLPITMFDLLLFMLVIYWIVEILRDGKKVNFFPAISIPALAYITLAGVSAFMSKDRELSIIMFVLMLKGYFIFLYFSNNIRKREEVVLVLIALAAAVLTQSLLGGIQHISGGTLGFDIFGEGERAFRTANIGYSAISRVGGTIGDANSLAMFLNFILPILLCFIFTDIDIRARVVIAVILVLGGMVEILTLSRGGWIALGFSGTLALFGVYKKILGSGIKSAILLSVSVLVVAVVVVAGFSDVRARLFEADYGAAYSRIPMMNVAANIIRDNPIRGVGLNNYTTVMNRFDKTRENISYNFPFPVHNAFLIIGAESGLPALLSFLLILLAILRYSISFFTHPKNLYSLLGIGWFSGVLSWVIHAQFKMDFAGINVVLWFSFGMIVSIHQLLNHSESHSPTHKKTWQRLSLTSMN